MVERPGHQGHHMPEMERQRGLMVRIWPHRLLAQMAELEQTARHSVLVLRRPVLLDQRKTLAAMAGLMRMDQMLPVLVEAARLVQTEQG